MSYAGNDWPPVDAPGEPEPLTPEDIAALRHLWHDYWLAKQSCLALNNGNPDMQLTLADCAAISAVIGEQP